MPPVNFINIIDLNYFHLHNDNPYYEYFMSSIQVVTSRHFSVLACLVHGETIMHELWTDNISAEWRMYASVNWVIIGLDVGLSPSHDRNQYEIIVSWTLRNKISVKLEFKCHDFGARKWKHRL